MASIFDDEEVAHVDDFPDYVLKKPKMNTARGVGDYHLRFNLENGSLHANDTSTEFGINKESVEVAQGDEEFNDLQCRTNTGRPRDRLGRRFSNELIEALELDIEECDDDE